jgi:FAD/FMN-containing dehydrogenase/Fe-S oxidoreductase
MRPLRFSDRAYPFGALAARLARDVEGEVLFDPASRGRYATDASIYQVMPIGVVVPKSLADIEATLALARAEGIPVLPRGGGTSQCGQTVNRAIVIDTTVHLDRLLAFDPERAEAVVEPGLVCAELNAALAPHGLFFPVDPSTHGRATLGGMAGNNSCGAKSIRYGLMADNVIAIEALLADGTPIRLGPEPAAPPSLLAALAALGREEAGEIAARFPTVLRRVGGYNIDALTPEAAASGRGNLARLLVGSEGTLAFFTRLHLKLSPLPRRKVLGVCQFPSFRAAMEATPHLVALDPDAVELVDHTMIGLAQDIPLFRPTIARLVRPGTESLLLVEFHGDEEAPLLRRLATLEEAMAELGHAGAVVRAVEPGLQSAIAALREAGLNIMMSMKEAGKPVSFIEDCAVPLADLAAYTARLEEVFARAGVRGTWYAHASVGCLHVRPVLNLKDPADVRRMRAIAEECFALVRAYKGSHSGEHGDGIVRSEFHAEMFGPRLVRAFERVKALFDPLDLFNPGRIVRPPRMDDRTLFRYPPGYGDAGWFRSRLSWSDHPGGFLGAVEMCNNNGACRVRRGGVMCPSFRASRAERDSTRGRANTLRLALTGQLGPPEAGLDAMAEALSLCLGCKACRRECPTGVDMARMKIEVQAALAAAGRLGRRERLVAALPRLAPWAARLAPLANALAASPGLRRRLGLAEDRPLPRFSRPFRPPAGGKKGGMPVWFLADTFNRYFEPRVLEAAWRVLEEAGFAPRLVGAGRHLCCGRTALAAGDVAAARRMAERVAAAVAGDEAPIIGCEPSCLLTLRDEYRDLLSPSAARALAARAQLFAEFLAERAGAAFAEAAAEGAAGEQAVAVHGHCHQKAFALFAPTVALLSRLPGLAVSAVEAGCCGMAGLFGYQAETAPFSREVAATSLLPALAALPAGKAVLAEGFSCRHQIRDLAGRPARHPAELLAERLGYQTM